MLDESMTWRGHWWTPENQDMRVPGILRYDPMDGLFLELIEGLNLEGDTVIHGVAGGCLLTLFEIQLTHEHIRFGGYRLHDRPDRMSEQIIQVGVALEGAFLDSIEQAFLTEMKCAAEGLLRWEGNSNPFEITLMSPDAFFKEKQPMAVQMVPLDDHQTTTGSYTVALQHSYTLPTLRPGQVLEATFSMESVLLLTSQEPTSFKAMREELYAVLDLVSLAVGHHTRIRDWKFRVPGEETEQWGSIYCGRRAAVTPFEDPGPADRPLFTLSNVSFEDVLEIWHRDADALRQPARAFLSERMAPNPFIETRIQSAVSTLEGLNKSLSKLPGWRRQEDRVKNRDGKLVWPSTLRQRLIEMANHLPDSVQERLVPDVQAWAIATETMRQELFHEGWIKTNHAQALAILKVTRAVILLNFAIQLSVPESLLLAALSDNKELRYAAEIGRVDFPCRKD